MCQQDTSPLSSSWPARGKHLGCVPVSTPNDQSIWLSSKGLTTRGQNQVQLLSSPTASFNESSIRHSDNHFLTNRPRVLTNVSHHPATPGSPAFGPSAHVEARPQPGAHPTGLCRGVSGGKSWLVQLAEMAMVPRSKAGSCRFLGSFCQDVDAKLGPRETLQPLGVRT